MNWFLIVLIMSLGMLCNNAHVSFDGTVTGNPTEQALLNAALQSGMSDIRDKYTRSQEIPFSSESKWMAVRCETPDGPQFFVKVSNA
jgi:Ca2+-transporting ATPase